MKKNNKRNLANHLNSVKELLLSDEQVLWEAKPKKSAYILSAIIKMMPIAILWIIFDTFFIMSIIKIMGTFPWFLWLFFAAHLIPVWIWIANIVKSVLEIKNIEYLATYKRLIVKRGVIADVINVSYADVTSIDLKVGLIDKILGVGDLYVDTKSQDVILSDVQTPYKVVNDLQQIAFTSKNDAYFPNAIREQYAKTPLQKTDEKSNIFKNEE